MPLEALAFASKGVELGDNVILLGYEVAETRSRYVEEFPIECLEPSRLYRPALKKPPETVR